MTFHYRVSIRISDSKNSLDTDLVRAPKSSCGHKKKPAAPAFADGSSLRLHHNFEPSESRKPLASSTSFST